MNQLSKEIFKVNKLLAVIIGFLGLVFSLLGLIVNLVLFPFHLLRIIPYLMTGHRRCWMCEDYRTLNKGKPDPKCPGCNGSGFKKI